MNKKSTEISEFIWNQIKNEDHIFIRGKSFYIFSRNREDFLDAMKNINECGRFVLSWNIFENFYNWGKEIYDGRPDRLNENSGYFIRFKILLKNNNSAEIELNFLTKSINKYKHLPNFIDLI